MTERARCKYLSTVKARVLCFALSACASASADDRGPLTVKDQGSMIAGGTVVTQPRTFDPYDPMKADGQTYHGDHVYAFYQIPSPG
jgi:hypothetical protein